MPKGSEVRAVLATAEARLRGAGVEAPQVDAELLLAHVLAGSRSAVLADGRRSLTAAQLEEVERLLARREAREPLAYVLGEWGFRRLTLKVDPRVLVPRPETEIVVERCLALVQGLDAPRILDVGTGSGAIALTLADEHPGAQLSAIDVSEDALAVARENAERLGLDVTFSQQDLFTGLPDGPWDLVVSNPPYVRLEDIVRLSPEVRDWEPRVALLGTGATEAIAESSRTVLREGGVLVLETAESEGERVVELLRSLDYDDVRLTRDLTGRHRVVEGRRT